MERTNCKPFQIMRSSEPAAVVVTLSLMVLPYFSYPGLLGLLGVTLWWLFQDSRAVWRCLNRQGLVLLSIGMVVSVSAAEHLGEAILQLANFLPFFLLFAAFSEALPRLKQPFVDLYEWALWLLMASMPISVRALVEYYLKAPTVQARLIDSPYFQWLYQEFDFGHRADSVFGHPNILAAHLTLLFGLGLGLIWLHVEAGRQGRDGRRNAPSSRLVLRPRAAPWIYLATGLIPFGIFSSGSRNGLLVAMLLFGLFAWFMRRYRWVQGIGLLGVMALSAATLLWGIGGRNLVEVFGTVNLRWQVWALGADLAQQHPWLGIGLGGFKLAYVPFSIPPFDRLDHGHNLWLTLSAEMGIPLTLLLTAVVGWICFRGVRALQTGAFKREELALLTGYSLGFLSCILFGLFDVTLYDARINALGWLMLATIQAMPRLAQRSRSDQLDCAEAKVEA